jgi:hypothetical protein
MQEIRTARFELASSHVFLASFILACAIAAAVIGSFPVAMSIATIFVFAGVHNFMEFRYFAARMPVRWGRSKLYYSVGIGGVLFLVAAYVSLYFASGNWLWSVDTGPILTASWNTAFVMWLSLLYYLRGRRGARSDRTWAFAAAFLLAALAWVVPQYWSLSLVYMHPFIAMWFLERQIRRSKPEWLRAYHCCLTSVPVFVVLLWIVFSARPDLPEDTRLLWRISQHAGSEILPGISSHFLVATHVFLESIHYFVWILLIPLIDRRAIPWRMREIPLFSMKGGYPRLVVAALCISFTLMLLLWAGFSVNYAVTRDIYFAFAIGHVMAEFPFLIKMI